MRRLLELAYGTYAALMLLAIALVFVAPVLLLPTLHLRREAGRLATRLAFALAGLPIRATGLKRLPAGPCVVVCNHASYLDGPLLTAVLPARFTFVVQHGAASWPVAGAIIRRMGVSFVHRGAARTGAAQTRGLIRRLRAGDSLTVFPEGTFKSDPGLLPFRNGAFLMAHKAGVPVVPAVVHGTRQVFGNDHRGLRWGRLRIELLEPIAPADADAMRAAARAAILARCGEPDAAHVHG